MHRVRSQSATLETGAAYRAQTIVRAARKRVAVVATSASAMPDVALFVIREARRRGHDVFCFAPDWDERSYRIASAYGAEPRETGPISRGVSPIADERAIRRLQAGFRSVAPDVVLGVSMKAAALSALGGRLAGVPHIVPLLLDFGSAVGALGQPSAWARRQIMKPFWWTALRASHGVILPNSGDKELLASLGLLPPHLQVTCIGAPGVNLDEAPHLALPPLDRGALFLMVADLRADSGVQDYCEAAELLRARARNARCLLVGKAAAGAGAVSLEELRRYRAAIQYLGPREDAVELVARSHCLVIPARNGGRPDIAIAALAFGRPIIATNTRGLPEAVEHGVNGYLVPPRDPVSLAKAMSYVLQRPDLIPRMANASRAVAERTFDIRAVTLAVLGALEL
ncbi:MAG: glycosyltransferase [Hyphomicrobiales bacterium]|nr:glycosyltransferase [Hyphomicrobiales bacterium]